MISLSLEMRTNENKQWVVQVTLVLSYTMLSTICTYHNGNSISAGRFGASSHMQLMNSPLSYVECDRPTFSIVQE